MIKCADRLFEQLQNCGMVYTDTMHSHFKLLEDNKYAQVFATEDFFTVTHPMKWQESADDVLKKFMANFGAA